MSLSRSIKKRRAYYRRHGITGASLRFAVRQERRLIRRFRRDAPSLGVERYVPSAIVQQHQAIEHFLRTYR